MTGDGAPPSLDRAGIVDLVQRELAEILERPPSDITLDATFGELGADSLALIELVEALEERLASAVAGFHIDDADLEGLTSVRDAVDYVSSKLQVS